MVRRYRRGPGIYRAPADAFGGGVEIIIASGQLVLSQTAVVLSLVEADISIEVPSADLTSTTSVPNVATSGEVIVPEAQLFLSASTVSLSHETHTISIPSVDLAFSPSVPDFAVLSPVTIEIPKAELTFSTSVIWYQVEDPGVVGELNAPSAQLTITTSAPMVSSQQPATPTVGGSYRRQGRPFTVFPTPRRKPKPKTPRGNVVPLDRNRFLFSAPPSIAVEPNPATLDHVVKSVNKVDVRLDDAAEKITAEIRSFAEAVAKREDMKAQEREAMMRDLEAKILQKLEAQRATDQELMTAMLLMMVE